MFFYVFFELLDQNELKNTIRQSFFFVLTFARHLEGTFTPNAKMVVFSYHFPLFLETLEKENMKKT